MQLANLNEQQLVSLARVYVKHRQFERSQAVRYELQARLEAKSTPNLSLLLHELDDLKPVPLLSKIRNLFVLRQSA